MSQSNRRQFLSAVGSSALVSSLAAQTELSKPTHVLSVSSDGCTFEWNIRKDEASVRSDRGNQTFWKGGLLPALLVQTPDRQQTYIKSVIEEVRSTYGASGGKLVLRFAAFAVGELEFRISASGFEIVAFEIAWERQPFPIINLYFGTAPLSRDEQAAAPVIDHVFWPNWESAGFAVPGAKGAPLASVFRRWDLGNAVLPLGSFGPSLGTPYAAAFPRPLYAAALGDDNGWICAGAGDIPDGALCFTVQSSSACLNILYREDLWGAHKNARREWKNPLRLMWAPDPWHAYQKYFATFDSSPAKPALTLKPQWNSWGDFRKQIFHLRDFAQWTKRMGAEIVGIDDRWESFVGSGEPHLERFSKFADDIRYIKAQGLQVGFWQAIGWVDQPQQVGLSDRDLIVGPDGVPRRTSWDTNPRNRTHYCLDPSSAKTVEFLQGRTVRLMERYQPVLLKLDFGYGLPSPHTGVPRDPSLRGERLSFRLAEIIAAAARSVNPNVAIEYYSLHPLWCKLVNVVALDDLGDAGNQEAEGHGQWSIWSALAGQRSILMASSGYDWHADADVVLNSAVLGVPGAVLSRTMEDGSPVPPAYINRRIALNRWYRRTNSWAPLWLNSYPGGYMRDPYIRSFGRTERIDETDRLTALALREKDKHQIPPSSLNAMSWTGDWALISQDDLDIFSSHQLACIPVGGTTLELPRPVRPNRILLVTPTTETNWNQWHWSRGRLSLEAPKQIDEMLGLFVLTS